MREDIRDVFYGGDISDEFSYLQGLSFVVKYVRNKHHSYICVRLLESVQQNESAYLHF